MNRHIDLETFCGYQIPMKPDDETISFSFKAIPEVDEAAVDLERAAKRIPDCQMADGKGGRKKPTKAGTISAILLHIEQLPPAMRAAILRDGFARYNAHREGTPQPARHDAVDPSKVIAPPPTGETGKGRKKG